MEIAVPALVNVGAPTLAVYVASLVAVVLTLAADGRSSWRARLPTALACALLLTLVALSVNLLALAIAIIAIAVVQATAPGETPPRVRMQRQVFGAALLVLGAMLLRAPTSLVPARVGAVALALGIVACVGLVPYLQRIELADPVVLQSPAWPGLVGPLVFIVAMTRGLRNLPTDAAPVFVGLLVAFGIVNLVFGVVAAWRAREPASTWHYSFLADWGLVLVGGGLLVPLGFSSAYLVLLTVLLCRFPMYAAFAADPRLESSEASPLSSFALLGSAALAGAAPFSGFAARLDLLRAATSLSMPLAVVLTACILLWLLHAVPLARALRLTAGNGRRVAFASLLLALVVGVYPAPFLGVAGLR